MWFKKYPGSCEWGRPYMKAILMRSDWTKQLSVATTRRHGCARVVGACHFSWALTLHHCRSTTCLPEPQLAGGKGGSCPPELLNCWAGQIKTVDGFVLFRLTYFDYSDLHLCSILMGEDTDPHPPSPLQGSCLRPCLLGLKKTCNVPVPWRLESHKLIFTLQGWLVYVTWDL